MHSEWIVLATAGGWVWGSFLNTLVDRTARAGDPHPGTALSPVRSRCMHCGRKLSLAELVPIVSYVALGGHCGTCHMPIGARTLVIEILTPVLFGVFALALAQTEQHSAWIILLSFGFSALSWLLVAIPVLVEERRPKPHFLAIGVVLFAGLVLTAVIIALDVMTLKA
jgi:prepilin signal peptidase PulO-like enzyme (type II secretory pathway)